MLAIHPSARTTPAVRAEIERDVTAAERCWLEASEAAERAG